MLVGWLVRVFVAFVRKFTIYPGAVPALALAPNMSILLTKGTICHV